MRTFEEKIIKYLDNDMTQEEKISFERELKNSLQLQEEFNKYLKIYERIHDTKKIKLNQDYLDKIVPEFRNQFQKSNLISSSRKWNYAFGVISAFVVTYLIFFNTITKNPDVDSINNFAESLDDAQKIEMLENLDYNQDDFILLSENIADMELTNLIQSSIIVDNELVDVYDINYNELVNDLDQVEADKIYKEIMNTNFSKEDNL